VAFRGLAWLSSSMYSMHIGYASFVNVTFGPKSFCDSVSSKTSEVSKAIGFGLVQILDCVL
jgi:hypothetical protein